MKEKSNSCGYSKKSSGGRTSNARGENYNVYTKKIYDCNKSLQRAGKTTLALRSAYLLQNEYTVYQVTVCDNNEQLGNTVQYFNSRLRLGKLLILIDNLMAEYKKVEWTCAALQAELPTNYKVLLTTREIDWYNYSGDLSNIRSINIIVPTLEDQEAKNIFQKLKETGNLHPSITNWKRGVESNCRTETFNRVCLFVDSW